MKKRIIKGLLFVTLLTLIFSNNLLVNADSGFDTDYDSSSSWDSDYSSSWDDNDYSSSWDDNDYSSSWDNDDYSSSGGSSYSSGGIEDNMLFSIGMTLIVFTIIIMLIPQKKEEKEENQKILIYDPGKEQKKHIEKMKVLIPNFDVNEFLNDRYNDYIDIQHAWSDFDYNALRLKLTDEIYNQYIMQLETLKRKQQKNVMYDFRYINSRITSVTENTNQIIVGIHLTTEFIDYIEKNNIVVRGSKNFRVRMHYSLVFVCDKTSTTTNSCPNCGAPLTKTSSQICPYCKTLIKTKSTNWRLSKKYAISQKKGG